MRKMSYLMLTFVILALILSGCNVFNRNDGASSKYRTNVNIVDPYGNKLFIDGTINGLKIQADKDGVFVAGKIDNVSNYKFDESLEVFEVSNVDVDPGKVVNITLRKIDKKGVKLFRTADGKLMFYAFGFADTPYFQVWLKDKLSSSAMIDLNKEQTLLAGNWLVGVGKGRGVEGKNMNKNEIVVKLPIVVSSTPRIVKLEYIK